MVTREDDPCSLRRISSCPKSYRLKAVKASGSSSPVSLGFREIQHFAAPVQPFPLNTPQALRSRVKAAMLGVTEAGDTAVPNQKSLL